MFSFALRRALWAVPTLFGISCVVFFLTTLLPEPAPAPVRVPRTTDELAAHERTVELRRRRFLDLPRFVNLSPADVRTRVRACLPAVASNDERALLCEHTLAQLGGAALPYVLPELEALAPPERRRVAAALSPIAFRMGLATPERLASPDDALRFWTRFWEDRSIDFTRPAVRRSVDRLLRHDSGFRREDVAAVDTFALEDLMDALERSPDRASLETLTEVLVHVTGRGEVARAALPDAEARAVRAEWRAFWFVHRADYVPFDGSTKLAASLSETQYARWVVGSLAGRFGVHPRAGRPILEVAVDRARVTLPLALAALLGSLALGVPLGAIAAERKGRTVDRAVFVALFALYAIPTFVVSQLLVRWTGPGGAGVLPVLTLTVASLAATASQQRAALLEVLAQDHVRAARARGAGRLRVLVAHGLRNVLVPTVGGLGTKLVSLVGAAVVVEEVFDLRGLGWETLRAAESRDAAWLVLVVLLTGALGTAAVVCSDVAQALVHPRLRERGLGRASP